MSAAQADTCVVCMAPLSSMYCPECGERRAADRHYTVPHFLGEAVEVFTHADNNLFRSVSKLVIRPGGLTQEFMAGRRKLYLGPLQMFLVMNLLFFLFESFIPSGPFAPTLKEITYSGGPQSLAGITHAGAPSSIAQRMVAKEVTSRKTSLEEMEAKFDRAVKVEARSMVITMVPMFTICLALLQVRQKTFVVQHLVFSLHFYAFVMLFSCALDAIEAFVDRLPWAGFRSLVGNYLIVVIFSVVCLYLFVSLRRVYVETRFSASIKAVALSVLVFFVLAAYRFILFVVTLHSV
jgi:hypothetical protein